MTGFVAIQRKWEARQQDSQRLGSMVSMAAVCAEVLADLQALTTATDAALLTPTEAAAVSDYHPESIARLVRTGKLANYGTKHRPRVKLSELPKKSRALGRQRVAKSPVAAASSVVGAIARDAVAGRIGRG